MNNRDRAFLLLQEDLELFNAVVDLNEELYLEKMKNYPANTIDANEEFLRLFKSMKAKEANND